MRLGNSGNGFEEHLSHFTSTNGATENFCQSSTTPMKRKVCPIGIGEEHVCVFGWERGMYFMDVY